MVPQDDCGMLRVSLEQDLAAVFSNLQSVDFTLHKGKLL